MISYLPLDSYQLESSNNKNKFYILFLILFCCLFFYFIRCVSFDCGFVLSGVVISETEIKISFPSEMEEKVLNHEKIRMNKKIISVESIQLEQSFGLNGILYTEAILTVSLPKDEVQKNHYYSIQFIEYTMTLWDKVIEYLIGGIE